MWALLENSSLPLMPQAGYGPGKQTSFQVGTMSARVGSITLFQLQLLQIFQLH